MELTCDIGRFSGTPETFEYINCYGIIKKNKEKALHRMKNGGDSVNSNGVDLNAAKESAISLADRSIHARIKYSYSESQQRNDPAEQNEHASSLGKQTSAPLPRGEEMNPKS